MEIVLGLITLIYVAGLFVSLYFANWFFEPEYQYEKEDLLFKCVFWPVTVPGYLAILAMAGVIWLLSRPFSWLEDWFYALPKPKKNKGQHENQ